MAHFVVAGLEKGHCDLRHTSRTNNNEILDDVIHVETAIGKQIVEHFCGRSFRTSTSSNVVREVARASLQIRIIRRILTASLPAPGLE